MPQFNNKPRTQIPSIFPLYYVQHDLIGAPFCGYKTVQEMCMNMTTFSESESKG